MRRPIETDAQVAFKGAIELAVKALELGKGSEITLAGQLGEVVNAALIWALVRLDPPTTGSSGKPLAESKQEIT